MQGFKRQVIDRLNFRPRPGWRGRLRQTMIVHKLLQGTMPIAEYANGQPFGSMQCEEALNRSRRVAIEVKLDGF